MRCTDKSSRRCAAYRPPGEENELVKLEECEGTSSIIPFHIINKGISSLSLVNSLIHCGGSQTFRNILKTYLKLICVVYFAITEFAV